MAPAAKKEAASEAKKRGPVSYLAFAELAPGWWALVAANRESSNVYALRKELRQEIADAQLDAGVVQTDRHRLVIIPTDQAHIVEAEQTITVKETFSKVTLKDGPPLASMIVGPPAHEPTEAEVAARMGSQPAPPEALLSPPDAQTVAADTAAQAALAAEATSRAAQVMPIDPDEDEDRGNPDVDPETGLSRRPASEARPEDEGRTVFAPDNDI